MKTLIRGDAIPQAGNLVLARVEAIGQHKNLHLPSGRRAQLFVGDEIIVCYGNRYAPDQFEATVPTSLEPCHLAAAGGIAASVLSRHGKMAQPTRIVPIGLVGDAEGRPLELTGFALKKIELPLGRPMVVVVVGTMMDSGKTTTAAHIIRGLVASGMKVGAAKVTGTGAGGDVWMMEDAGARPVFDFVDAGYASTYRVATEKLIEVVGILVSHLVDAGVEAVILEVADGIYQEETAALLSSPYFATMVDGVIFAAGDAVGAGCGAAWLRHRNLRVLAISGILTNSPLTMRETRVVTGLPVLDTETLSAPSIADSLRTWIYAEPPPQVND
jgi:hypothetical protein